MEITNKERREVARKLRAIPHVDYFGYDSINPTDLWRTIGFLRTVDGRIPTAEVRYLADLIDRPTCRKVIPNEMEGYVFCSKCGVEIGKYGVPNYCPNCGAEVQE